MTCIDVTLPPLAPDRPLLLVVAAALIDEQGRILLTERPPGKAMAGLWEFPGGKMGAHETPEAALVRELREELGIECAPSCFWPLGFASHAYERFHLLMPLFGLRVWQGTPEGREGQRLSWVFIHELHQFAMPPADVPLVEALRAML